MKVAFRVDASALIGGGHAMRCLTLADALRDRGAETVFVCAAIPPALADHVRASGHALHHITAPAGLDRAAEDWDQSELERGAQLGDAERTVAALAQPVDWLGVDHYLLGAPWHQAARVAAARLLVIDDLANRSLDCDLLLDQMPGRDIRNYASLVPESAAMLLGASYALLRPEFARERPAALARRRTCGPVQRILLSLGTTDVGGNTGEVLETIIPVTDKCAIDVVIGADAPSLDKVRALATANRRVTVHVDARNMAELMRNADVAIGAAGTTSWERCCLGLPSLTLVLAANQADVATALFEAEASITVETVEIAGILLNLLSDAGTRARMSAAALALVDGQGAGRVARHLAGETRRGTDAAIRLRAADVADSEALWMWRNDRDTRSGSRSTRPIVWADHARWFERVLDSGEQDLWIAECDGLPAGMVRFERASDDARYEVSINVRPDARSVGIGGTILRLACAALADRHGPVEIVAAVHEANHASQRLFERCDFVLDRALSRESFRRYVRSMGIPRSRKSA